MKKLFLLTLQFQFICIFSHAQDSTLNRVASFKNYGQQLHHYLRSQHELIYNKELSSVKKKVIFLISFNIDVKGNIVDYETKVKNGVDLKVANYIKKLIYLTSGYWHPEIKNCTFVKSDKILCRIDIVPKDFLKYDPHENRELTLEDLKIDTSLHLNFDEPNRCFLILNL